MITVLAKLVAKPGMEARLAEACITQAKEVNAKEKDCLLYIPHVSKENPTEITFFEKYTDQEAFEAHKQTPYFKSFSVSCADLLAGDLEVQILEELI